MPASEEIGYGPYNGRHLNIEVAPVEEKDFYFTDDKPFFRLYIENIGSEEFDDDLRWFMAFPGGRETSDFCSVSLKPGEKSQYTVGGRLLGFPGTAALCVTIPRKVPVRGLVPDDIVTRHFHILHTFEVYDRALYRREQREKWFLRFGVIFAFLTLIAVVIFGLYT